MFISPAAYAKAYALYESQTNSDEQDRIAWTAYYVALDQDVSDELMLAAFEAGYAESGMRNLDHGDRDSLGVLQQRGSWGSVEERRTPEWAFRKFFAASADQRLKVPFGQGAHKVAQAIQRSECDGSNPADPTKKDGKRWMKSCDGGEYGGNYRKQEKKSLETIDRLRKESALPS